MERNPAVNVYFKEHAPLTEYRAVTVRAVNAIMRGRINTMDALCALSPEELNRIRNLGEKCAKLALLMREKYEAEA